MRGADEVTKLDIETPRSKERGVFLFCRIDPSPSGAPGGGTKSWARKSFLKIGLDGSKRGAASREEAPRPRGSINKHISWG